MGKMLDERLQVNAEMVSPKNMKGAEASDFEYRLLKQLRIAFWIVGGATGFLQIWLRDNLIFGDSLSYLDSGEMLWRGDFANAITNHWSPGFPFLLGLALKLLHPAGLWELVVVKLVDLIIFLFALGSFDYFVSSFCQFQESTAVSEHRSTTLIVPKAALATAAYLLFIWTATRLLPAWYTTPDTLVTGIVYIVFGLLLRIRTGATGLSLFAVLGAVLGCGYLVKAPMFPLAFMFLGIAFLLVGNLKKAAPRIALAFGLFAIIASPLVVRLSEVAGDLTFGKSGAWNYARTVNGITFAYHWRGLPAGSGKALHPTRVLFQTPTVYEFGSPVQGTFPPWRDPYYWFAGITPHFDLPGQLRVLKGNVRIYEGLASGLNRSFIYGFLILLCMSDDKRLIAKIVTKQWFLFIPSIATLAMFSVVLVEGRYIAPYPIVICLAAFSGVAVVSSAGSVKLVNRTVMVMAALFAVSSARPAMGELLSFVSSFHRDAIVGRGGPWQTSSAAVSNALREGGLRRGDRIAYIGESEDFYWARLAGVQVNAEIRQFDPNYYLYSLVPTSVFPGLQSSVDIYWAASPDLKQRIDHILHGAGSKVIVTDDIRAGGDTMSWDHVPGTPYYIHPLSSRAENDSKRSKVSIAAPGH